MVAKSTKDKNAIDNILVAIVVACIVEDASSSFCQSFKYICKRKKKKSDDTKILI